MGIRDAIPGLPPVPQTVDPATRQFMQAVRDALQVRAHQTKNIMDYSPTVRDLVAAGVIDVQGNSIALPIDFNDPDDPGSPWDDISIPAAPTGLVVNATPWMHHVSWDIPADSTHAITSHAEIWFSATNDRDTALMAGIGMFAYSQAVDPLSTYYYWVRFVSHANVYGYWSSTRYAGVVGVSDPDPGTLLSILSGQITEGELYQDLNDRIDYIDLTDGGLISRVSLAEGDISGHTTAIGNLTTRVTDNEGDIDANATLVSGLQTDLNIAEGTIDAHAISLTQHDTRITTNFDDIAAQATLISGVQTDLNLAEQDISAHGISLTQHDTRITTNFDELAAQSILINSAQTDLDIAEGTIDAHAISLTQHDTRITTNFDDIAAQAILISGVRTDLTDAEQDIEANATSLSLYDTRITTNADDILIEAGRVDQVNVTLNHSSTGLAAAHAGVQTNADAIIDVEGDITTVESKYSVKVDANGYIAGFGLIATSNNDISFSEFGVSVDRFWIASPGDTSMSFVVDNNRVVMDAAFIKDATITGAKIGNAAIDTAHIGNLTVTEGKIQDLAVSNAKIGNTIQSQTLNLGGGRGWIIDKTGSISAAELTIYDHTGDKIIESAKTFTNYNSEIHNAQQRFSEVSELPDYLDFAAFAMAPQGVYGNVWFEHNQPSTGLVKIRGTTLYQHDGTKHTITDDQTLETWPGPGAAWQGFIFFTPRTCKSEFAGYTDGTNHRSDWFFVATLNADRSAFDVWDGTASNIQTNWIPLKDTPIVATVKSSGDGGPLDIFNSLIGANLDLPADGATKTGMASMVVDGGLYRFSQVGTFNLDPNWTVTNGSVSAATKFTRKGYVPEFKNASTIILQSNSWCEVPENTPVYTGVSAYLDNTTTAGTVDIDVDFYDADKALIGTYNHILQFGEGYVTWHLETFVDITPDHTSFVQVSFHTTGLAGGSVYLDTLTCSLAPQEINTTTTRTFIKDLSVDTLQVQDQAITQPVWGELTQSYGTGGLPIKILGVPFMPSAPDVPILITLSVKNESDYGDGGSRMTQFRRDGAVLRENHCFYTSGGGSLKPNFGLSTMMVDLGHGGVPVFYEIWIWSNDNAFNTSWSGLSITEMKK